MAGNITSLGIGSGVLTADVIEQLREADENAIIKPIDKKIDLTAKKQEAYSLLNSLMTSFKASASALSNDTIFDNKSVNVSGDAEVSISPGVNIDDFSLETTALAKKDVHKFGSFADRDTTKVADSAGTLKINDTLIEYTVTMSLQDLAQAITDAGGDSFSASILQTGENAFDLVVTAKETGVKNALVIEDLGNGGTPIVGLKSALTTGLSNIQPAKDAVFKYNGIEITRSSNTIDDLIAGVNITLKKEGDFSNVDVKLDTSTIVDEVQMFVDSYNELLTNLNKISLADVQTGEEGVFNNDSFIKSISREMSSMLSSFSVGGQSLTGIGHQTTNSAGEPVTNYVFNVTQDGKLLFDAQNLEKTLDQDPESMRALFSGSTDGEGVHTPGIFDMINEKLLSYTGSGKLLSNFETGLETEAKNFAQSRKSAIASLDSRYATMASRFAAYDSMISQINAQFSSLQMMINEQSK